MVSPCDSTINHKQTTSHGAQDISQCIMEFYIQLTPLNNYASNCVIKLPMKLLTPNLPLSNCVIKLHTKLQGHPPSATWEPNCASFACRGSGCFLHPVQEARSNGCLDQHFAPHDVTSSKMLFIDFQARWYIVQCHIILIKHFLQACGYVMQVY
jgi:hypothetical protein